MIRKLYCMFSIFFLLVGMSIYLIFRDMNILLFKWIPKPEFLGLFSVQLKQTFLSSIFLYNIPDMFWFLSGILLFRFIWFHEAKLMNIYLVCFYFLAFLMEICQLSEKVPGTFDIMDMSFMGIGALIEGLIYNLAIKRSIK